MSFSKKDLKGIENAYVEVLTEMFDRSQEYDLSNPYLGDMRKLRQRERDIDNQSERLDREKSPAFVSKNPETGRHKMVSYKELPNLYKKLSISLSRKYPNVDPNETSIGAIQDVFQDEAAYGNDAMVKIMYDADEGDVEAFKYLLNYLSKTL